MSSRIKEVSKSKNIVNSKISIGIVHLVTIYLQNPISYSCQCRRWQVWCVWPDTRDVQSSVWVQARLHQVHHHHPHHVHDAQCCPGQCQCGRLSLYQNHVWLERVSVYQNTNHCHHSPVTLLTVPVATAQFQIEGSWPNNWNCGNIVLPCLDAWICILNFSIHLHLRCFIINKFLKKYFLVYLL